MGTKYKSKLLRQTQTLRFPNSSVNKRRKKKTLDKTLVTQLLFKLITIWVWKRATLMSWYSILFHTTNLHGTHYKEPVYHEIITASTLPGLKVIMMLIVFLGEVVGETCITW